MQRFIWRQIIWAQWPHRRSFNTWTNRHWVDESACSCFNSPGGRGRYSPGGRGRAEGYDCMLKKLLKWKLILPDERDAKQNTPLHYVEERQAFVYKGKNGTYTAVDKKKKVLKLARPLRRCVEKHESEVFQFAEGAELILPGPEDLSLKSKSCRGHSLNSQ
jgi:hypothetical protein